MKFTDGFWLMREGVRASYATEIRDLHVGDDQFTAYASVKRVAERGDTLNTPSSRSTASPRPRASSACAPPTTPEGCTADPTSPSPASIRQPPEPAPVVRGRSPN